VAATSYITVFAIVCYVAVSWLLSYVLLSPLKSAALAAASGQQLIATFSCICALVASESVSLEIIPFLCASTTFAASFVCVYASPFLDGTALVIVDGVVVVLLGGVSKIALPFVYKEKTVEPVHRARAKYLFVVESVLFTSAFWLFFNATPRPTAETAFDAMFALNRSFTDNLNALNSTFTDNLNALNSTFTARFDTFTARFDHLEDLILKRFT